MRPYVIRQGDYITKLGHIMGFDPATIWAHAKNSNLRELRPDRDLLHPGDILWVPDSPDHRKLALKAGMSNRYAARIPTKPVDIRLQIGGEPLANEPYIMLGLGPEPLEASTDEQGWLKTLVPVHVREVEVLLPKKNRTLRVRIGDLDPIDTLSGLRKRLLHLGYYQPSKIGAENPEATDGEALIAALKAFQAAKELPVTGKLDDETKKALIDAHGS